MIADFRDYVENYFNDNWIICPVVYESADAKPKGEFVQLFITPLTGSNTCQDGNTTKLLFDVRLVVYSDTRYNTDVLLDEVLMFMQIAKLTRKNDIIFEANGSMQANMWFSSVSFTFEYYPKIKGASFSDAFDVSFNK